MYVAILLRIDMIKCDDGRAFPVAVQYNWDINGNGIASAFNDGSCGDEPGRIEAGFTLTQVA